MLDDLDINNTQVSSMKFSGEKIINILLVAKILAIIE